MLSTIFDGIGRHPRSVIGGVLRALHGGTAPAGRRAHPANPVNDR
ncbi:hypothetical protein [Dactylosporangium sp. NPDC050588]